MWCFFFNWMMNGPSLLRRYEDHQSTSESDYEHMERAKKSIQRITHPLTSADTRSSESDFVHILTPYPLSTKAKTALWVV